MNWGKEVLQVCGGSVVVPTAVFDLDGTLVDTSGDMIAAANACLGEPVLTPATDANIAFAGGRAMLEAGSLRQGRLWTQTEIDAAYPEFLARYSQVLSQRSKIYPGAREAVGALRENGWRVAICTNKPEDLAQAESLLKRAIPLFDQVKGTGNLQTILTYASLAKLQFDTENAKGE